MAKVACPACGKEIAVKGIPGHTNKCPKWDEVIGVPPRDFNFDAHYKRGLYAEGLVEGEDYVECRLCEDVRAKRLADHLKRVHKLKVPEYRARFPDAPTSAKGVLEARKRTTRERYGVDNVFQAEEIKAKSRETMLEKHGVEHNQYVPEINAKRVATNLRRYGAENPFGSVEIQEKIRQANLDRFGVENPNQSPEVMARRMATNRERYGADHFLETEAFKVKSRETSRERFGADHPMQSEEGKAIWEASNLEKLGVRTALLLPEVQQRAYETNLRNHGGKHSQQCPEVRAKAQAVWMEKHGVDNPSKLDWVKAKIKEVWLGKYGVPFPPQSLWTNRTQSFPNKLEKAVDDLSPARVVYAGDGSYWVRCKGAGRARNPDFVVLKPDQLKAYQEGTDLNDLRTSAVIEVFGDYWHGPVKTGKARSAHKHEVESYYGAAGIVCLVLWEREVKGHPKRVAERIKRFLAKWARGTYRKKETPTVDVFDLFGA